MGYSGFGWKCHQLFINQVLSQFGYSVGADSVSQSVQRLIFLFAIRSKIIQLLIKRLKIFLLFKIVPVVHMQEIRNCIHR